MKTYIVFSYTKGSSAFNFYPTLQPAAKDFIDSQEYCTEVLLLTYTSDSSKNAEEMEEEIELYMDEFEQGLRGSRFDYYRNIDVKDEDANVMEKEII